MELALLLKGFPLLGIHTSPSQPDIHHWPLLHIRQVEAFFQALFYQSSLAKRHRRQGARTSPALTPQGRKAYNQQNARTQEAV